MNLCAKSAKARIQSGAFAGLPLCSGGIPYAGVIFEANGNLAPANKGRWSESVLYSFQGTPDGSMSLKGVAMGQNGHLYGTTYFGGNGACYDQRIHGCGIVFEIIP